MEDDINSNCLYKILGKLRGMMPTIISIGERLRRKMHSAVERNETVEIKDLTIRLVGFRSCR